MKSSDHPSHLWAPSTCLGLAAVCLLVTLASEGGWDVGLGIASVGDSGGSGGPVGVVLQLQGHVHVAHPGRFVPPTEQPREEGRGSSGCWPPENMCSKDIRKRKSLWAGICVLIPLDGWVSHFRIGCSEHLSAWIVGRSGDIHLYIQSIVWCERRPRLEFYWSGYVKVWGQNSRDYCINIKKTIAILIFSCQALQVVYDVHLQVYAKVEQICCLKNSNNNVLCGVKYDRWNNMFIDNL